MALPTVVIEFTKFRCPGCGRLLFKHWPDAELWLEIRCARCKTIVRCEGDAVDTRRENLTTAP